MGIFKNKKEILASTNNNRSCVIWWFNCFKPGLLWLHLFIQFFKVSSILGISAFYHDSAACILKNGEIVAAAQEERFTRKKHDSSYPKNAVNFVLDYAKLKLSEVDQVVFFEKPFLKFERLLETYVAFAPRGFLSFAKAMPIWIKDKLFQKNMLFNKLNEHD